MVVAQTPVPVPPPEALPSPEFILAAVLASLPIVGVMVWGGVKVLGPISQALARRIGGHADSGEDLRAELAELHREVGLLRDQLTETQDRLDFTERLLTQRKSPAPPAAD